uniref:Uncharacterized protein n=1 Tax=Avena sativa TaxID=4498 RepID=A0ACD5VLH7_AVESA
MDIGKIDKKVGALEAELAAKYSRIAEQEARVSLLEAENARFRKAVPEGEAMYPTGESGPTIGRLEGGFGGNKRKPVDKLGEHVVDDVIDVSDGEEEGMAVDVDMGDSAEVGVPTVPTPVKCAMRVSTGQSDDEVEILDAEEGRGGNIGSVCCDAHVDLEDDVSITPQGKHRAVTRVISDSESGDDGGHENEEVCVTSSRKRVLLDVSDSESEDVDQGVESEDDDGELYEMEGRFTPATRRSARLVESRSKRIQPARQALEFLEPKDHEKSEENSEEDDSMGGFIDDADCTENSADAAEEYSAELEESDNEENYERGGGNIGSVCCHAHVDLEDDDVSNTPQGNHRAAARVISDSESGDDDEDDGGNENEEVCVTSSRKRVLCDVSDCESEDVAQGVDSKDDDDELYEMEGCSTPATRRSARLVERRSKRIRPARRTLEFVEPKDHEESEGDSEEDDNMDEFIDDADCTENSAVAAEEYSAGLEEDNEENYEDLMARLRGRRNAKNEEWDYEAEMLSAFAEQPELCLKAVCALYRKQTEEEKTQRSTIVHNKKGFNQIDAPRGSRIAQFLLDGDASGPLKKTAEDLEKYERYGLEFCHRMAERYSRQLFAIYKEKEDPYFP